MGKQHFDNQKPGPTMMWRRCEVTGMTESAPQVVGRRVSCMPCLSHGDHGWHPGFSARTGWVASCGPRAPGSATSGGAGLKVLTDQSERDTALLKNGASGCRG